jgi:hypothetical protein
VWLGSKHHAHLAQTHHLVCGVKFFSPISRSIKIIEHKLITKIITEMNRKLQANPLGLINPSLGIGYCSTMLFNHDIIRLVRFMSKIKVGIVE